MSLGHVLTVLSRPSEPRNVGAACRALKNAGMFRLTVVADAEIDLVAARPLAVGATDVLDSARIVGNLSAALEGSSLVAGITRRTGQRRKLMSFTPWELAAKVTARSNRDAGGDSRGPGSPAPAAIVFGNEQSGLSDEELELCHMAVSIPTAPDQPSLNLSHAVQVISYELFIADIGMGRDETGNTGPADRLPADRETLAAEVSRITAALNAMGFLTQGGPQGMPTLLRDILGRAMVSGEELVRVRAMFEKLEGMHR